MFEAARFQLPYDFGRFPGHLLDNRAFDRGEIKRTAAQHNHRLVAVKRQVSELQHNLESPAADHHYIDAGKEFREPVRLLRSEEHTSELQSHSDLVCRLLLEKKKTRK